MAAFTSVIRGESLVIPKAIVDRVAELNALATDYPETIPVPVAARFLRMGPDSLRLAIELGTAPFGISWQKTIKGNRSFVIPTLPFYIWATQGRSLDT